MDSYLAIYTDMLLSLQLGNYRGFVSLSKPLYVLAIIDSIEAIESNRINIDNLVIEQQFKKLYQRFQGDFVYTRAAYIAPFFHLDSSDFYHLIWKDNVEPPSMSSTPSPNTSVSICNMLNWMMSCGSCCKMIITENTFDETL